MLQCCKWPKIPPSSQIINRRHNINDNYSPLVLFYTNKFPLVRLFTLFYDRIFRQSQNYQSTRFYNTYAFNFIKNINYINQLCSFSLQHEFSSPIIHAQGVEKVKSCKSRGTTCVNLELHSSNPNPNHRQVLSSDKLPSSRLLQSSSVDGAPRSASRSLCQNTYVWPHAITSSYITQLV